MARTELQKVARTLLSEQRKSLRKQMADLKGQERRTDALANLLDTLPQKIKSRSKIDWYISGSMLYVTVRPAFKRFTENDTILITDWCARQEKFDFAKEVSSSTGTWNHKLKRWIGWAYYNIEFDTIANVDGCELVEVEETIKQKRFEVKCD